MPFCVNGVIAVGSCAAVAIGAGLTAAGFTSSGIASRSIASAVQSGIGKMSAGSVFAKVQSLGVTGVVTEVGVAGAIGLLVLAPYV